MAEKSLIEAAFAIRLGIAAAAAFVLAGDRMAKSSGDGLADTSVSTVRLKTSLPRTSNVDETSPAKFDDPDSMKATVA